MTRFISAVQNTQRRNITAFFIACGSGGGNPNDASIFLINQLGYNSPMEKHTPHCKLSVIKTLIETEKVRATVSALKDAAALGFDFADMLTIICALTPADFYKSMTTHADHRIWQDVYHANT